ncbi:MAG: hypothetical protein VB861_16960 [Planctomycetaceae bacterium]
MPAFFARRLLPLMCGDPHMVSRSVLELAEPSSLRPIQDGSGAEDGWPARYVGW